MQAASAELSSKIQKVRRRNGTRMPLRTLAAAAAVGLAAFWARQGDTAREAASRRLPIAIDAGNPQSGIVLLFLHGWPDNAKEFQKQISFFSELGYRCVAAELPMTEHGEKATWGHDFDVLAQQLSNLAEFLRGENRSLVLLGHDWGAWLTYMAQRQDPHLFDAIVPMDIAPGYGELPFSVKWRVVAYQQFALACFLLGKLPLMQDAANKLLRHFMEQLRFASPCSDLRGRHGRMAGFHRVLVPAATSRTFVHWALCPAMARPAGC
eukprot:s2650_g11.t3